MVMYMFSALVTISSRGDLAFSSSSYGSLHIMLMIWARVKPAHALFFRSTFEILMFHRQMGLNLNVLSSSFMSLI